MLMGYKRKELKNFKAGRVFFKTVRISRKQETTYNGLYIRVFIMCRNRVFTIEDQTMFLIY